MSSPIKPDIPKYSMNLCSSPLDVVTPTPPFVA
jgi:hypothetical protein